MTGLVSYDFLHGLGRRQALSVVAAFEGVIQRYAVPPAVPETGILLDLAADDDPTLNAAHAELCARYGREPSVQKGFGVDGRAFRAYRWVIDSHTLDSALAITSKWQSREPVLATRLGVQMWWKFFWRDPVTGDKLPDQDPLPVLDVRRPGPSSIGLTLTAQPRAAFWLLFPFPALEERAMAYVRAFESALPTRLSDKHWRLWKPDKHGEWKPRKCNPLARAV